MYNLIFKITVIISLLLNNSEQVYALRSMAYKNSAISLKASLTGNSRPILPVTATGKSAFLNEQPLVKGNTINVYELEKLFNKVFSRFSKKCTLIWGSCRYMADPDGFVLIAEDGYEKVGDIDMIYNPGAEKYFLDEKFAPDFAELINKEIRSRGCSGSLRFFSGSYKSFVYGQDMTPPSLYFTLQEGGEVRLSIQGYVFKSPGHGIYEILTKGLDEIFKIATAIKMGRKIEEFEKKYAKKIIGWYFTIGYLLGKPENYERFRTEWVKIRVLEHEYGKFSTDTEEETYRKYLVLGYAIVNDEEFEALRQRVEDALGNKGPLIKDMEATLQIQTIEPGQLPKEIRRKGRSYWEKPYVALWGVIYSNAKAQKPCSSPNKTTNGAESVQCQASEPVNIVKSFHTNLFTNAAA